MEVTSPWRGIMLLDFWGCGLMLFVHLGEIQTYGFFSGILKTLFASTDDVDFAPLCSSALAIMSLIPRDNVS